MKRRDPTRIFFWVVYGFLALVWWLTVKEPAFRTAGRLIPFTVLLIVHGYLHGSIHRWLTRRRAPVYMVAQTVLAAVIFLMSDGGPVQGALFFPIAGEVFGLFPNPVPRIISLGGLAVAWFLTLLSSFGWSTLGMQIPGAVLALAFIGIYVTVFTRQMEERERAEKLLGELEQAHAKLKAYALKVEELTVVQERQRMARELHDTLAQGLAGLIMQLEAVDDLLTRGDTERARAITRRAMQRARTTLQEARTAIAALRSPLDKGDVMEAIRRVVDNLTADTGITCTFEAGPGDLHLQGPVAETVYRVVQEGLANIARHSQAHRAWVRLAVARPQGVTLEVGDDGIGFDPTARRGAAGHFGLTGLAERIGLAEGTLEVQAAPGAGTRLIVTLPLKEDSP
ncbi:MAG TPA: sensor histidine kinase [Symbiobacteriaceae bacterium]|nr:sensor histidine kinase [Symbiobacteriaceae bacterium]